MHNKFFLVISLKKKSNTVDSRYLEFQGTHWNSSRYPYWDYQSWESEENNKLNNHI